VTMLEIAGAGKLDASIICAIIVNCQLMVWADPFSRHLYSTTFDKCC
jgi:hypothetical protein